jgi:hypothetical protein
VLLVLRLMAEWEEGREERRRGGRMYRPRPCAEKQSAGSRRVRVRACVRRDVRALRRGRVEFSSSLSLRFYGRYVVLF